MKYSLRIVFCILQIVIVLLRVVNLLFLWCFQAVVRNFLFLWNFPVIFSCFTKTAQPCHQCSRLPPFLGVYPRPYMDFIFSDSTNDFQVCSTLANLKNYPVNLSQLETDKYFEWMIFSMQNNHATRQIEIIVSSWKILGDLKEIWKYIYIYSTIERLGVDVGWGGGDDVNRLTAKLKFQVMAKQINNFKKPRRDRMECDFFSKNLVKGLSSFDFGISCLYVTIFRNILYISRCHIS